MSAAGLVDIILSTAQYFPTAVGVTLGVGGLATARMPWVLTAVGMAILGCVMIAIHLVLGRTPLREIRDSLSGRHVYEICSLTPIPGADATYFSVPSMWVTLTAFLMMIIMLSAGNVATTNPTTAPKDAIPVQQRKGVGTLSLLAAVILFLFLLLLRVRTGCETLVGILLGIIIGAGFGLAWWAVMRTGGPAVWDVHGVMLGTQPGPLRTSPLACLPMAPK
jgi:hypothetical protein